MTATIEYGVIVIGAGPAGLFCAAQAGSTGIPVLLLEKNSSAGKKLLLTGSGQCNITHEGTVHDFLGHYGNNGHFLRPALMNFPNSALVSFFLERGLGMVATPAGKVFPETMKSSDVKKVLVSECISNQTELRYNEPVCRVTREGSRFVIGTSASAYTTTSLVIATGGASYPATGSSGDGYSFARQLGHTIVEPAPALTPVEINQFPFGDLSGISLENIFFSHWREGKKLASGSGDILLTHHGLSGPGILDFSRFITAGDTLRVSFIGRWSREALVKDLSEKLSKKPVALVRTALQPYNIPVRLLEKIIDLSGIPQTLTCAHLAREQRNALVMHLLEFPLVVRRPGGFNEAMVTRGGVALQEIDPRTLQSRLVPGLYFAGEIIDIDGDTGGYNLQAAFSTGYLAAQSLSRGRTTKNSGKK